VRTWVRPRAVMRNLLVMGPREDRALIFLMVSCMLIFVAQWPRLSREAFYNPEIPLQALLGATLLAWVFMAPILLYGVGALSHIVARIFGGKGSWFSARLALFWTLLSVSPAFLFYGMIAGFIGPGPAQTYVGAGLVLAFVVIWGMTLFEAEQSPEGSEI
jgi:hypothetical protein